MSAIRPYRWTGMMALRAGRHGGLHLVGVHGEVVRADVDEDRPRADLEDDAGRRVEGEADGDDLVARADAQAAQDASWATVPLAIRTAWRTPQ